MTEYTAMDTSNDEQEAMGDVDQKNDPNDIQNFKKKTISGAISYTLRSLFLYGIGIGTSLVLGAYLTAAEFGIYGLVTQIVGLLQFFSDVGLGPALIQKKSEPTLKEYRTVFTVQQALTWVLFGVMLLIVQIGIFADKLGTAGEWVLLALTISLPISSLKVISAIKLERKLDFQTLVIPSIIEQLVYNAVLLTLVLKGYGVVSYAWAVGLRAIVGVIAMFVIQPWRAGIAFDWKIIKKTLRVGVQFQASDFLAKVKDQIFYLVLGWWLPLTQFGYITWSKSWSQVPYMLTVQNVIAITFPTYSRLQNNTKLLTKAIEKSMYFISISIFPILVGMSVMIRPFTELVPQYEKWQPALFTFILFTLNIGWAAISTPLTNTMNAIGKVSWTLRLMIMWTSLTWLVTPISIVFFGFNGVAIATMIISLTSLIPVYLVKKLLPNLDVFAQVKTPLFASAIMGCIGLFSFTFMGRSWLHFLGGGVLLGISYICAVLVVGRHRLIQQLDSLGIRHPVLRALH